jgi:hypothetical protein
MQLQLDVGFCLQLNNKKPPVQIKLLLHGRDS